MEPVNKTFENLRHIMRSRWLPWGIVGLTLFALGLYELFLQTWLGDFARLSRFAFWALLLLGLVLAYLTVSRLSSLDNQREQLAKRLAETEQQVADAYQRLEDIFRVSQQFIEASEEKDVVAPVLRLAAQFTGAEGVSFVPLDEHGQPQAALKHGDLPFPVLEAWVEYLATPGVRERCRSCQFREPLEKPASCPLLHGPFKESAGMLCLSVSRGEREFGVLNLFLKESADLDERTRIYLRALADEMALGLEGLYLRQRELSALRPIQVLRQRADLTALLSGPLDNLLRAVEADFVVMVAPRSSAYQAGIDLSLGDLPPSARHFADGVLQGVMASGEPVLLGDVSGDPDGGSAARPSLRSLMAAPLFSSERGVIGALLVGHRRARGFHRRQLALLQTIAGQLALVVQNASLMAELEYKSMIQERARLAREIHDGLAQTLGFLKLQASQLRTALARGDQERLRQNLDLMYATLSEAYQDARQAIDGLRISLDECGLPGWLTQSTQEFQDLSGLQVDLELAEIKSGVQPEIQAQLVRILQEALSNVRKHAQASHVWVACSENSDDLVLEVRDDGDGFSPEDVSSASQHGLRGMRERAELIGADFQVISRPHSGTTVRIRLPIRNLEETVR